MVQIYFCFKDEIQKEKEITGVENGKGGGGGEGEERKGKGRGGVGGGKILPWRNAITECNEYFCEEINCNMEVSFFDSCNYLPEIKNPSSSFFPLLFMINWDTVVATSFGWKIVLIAHI